MAEGEATNSVADNLTILAEALLEPYWKDRIKTTVTRTVMVGGILAREESVELADLNEAGRHHLAI
jgi:hypothetical protein